MKYRLYALKHYTESGDLKAPPILLYILLFLSRTWILLASSVVARQTGNEVLQLFYPDKHHFYLGLALGCLPLLVFIISGRRHAQDKWAFKYWPYCYYLILLSLFGDIGIQFYYLYLEHFKYSITASVQLVAVAWSFIYAIQSQQLKDCFKKQTK